MSYRRYSNVPVMLEPEENSETLLKRLKNTIENKYDVKLDNYQEFHKWSVDHLTEFWAEMWDFIGIICSKKFEQVVDLTVPMADSPEWFRGAKLNFAENLLKFRDERVALIISGEDRESEKVTFSEMYSETELYASAFKALGLTKGDRVACYVSNRKEPVIAMLAVTSIGAIWTGALPQLGSEAVVNRLKQVTPKILLTIDRFRNDKQEIEMLEKIKEIANALPSLEKVIIIPSRKDSKLKDISDIRNSCFLDDFLKLGVDGNGQVPSMEFEQVSFSHPVFINFTSGTTGLPKALVHGFGALLPTQTVFGIMLDSSRDSIWFCMSPVGWVSWHFTISLLSSGATIFLYEGVPYYLSPTYFWDMIDEYKITSLFLPPIVFDKWKKLGYFPTENHHLKSLKTCISGGSIVKPDAYDFMYKKVKKNMLFTPIYGSTEVIGTCLSANTSLTIRKGEISAAVLGVDLQCVNESGKPVEGEIGELIVCSPLPNFLIGIWNDTDGSLCRKTYYSKYSGKFSMGDFGIVNPITKGYLICGRSDDTLKQRGTRFGSSEIYNVLDTFHEINDSVCVSQYNKHMDERAVLFLKMREGHVFDNQLVDRIQQSITKELTPEHVPEVILEIQDIPYNASIKKMETIVKKIINKRPYNSESIMNQECVKYYCDIPELQDF